MNNLLWNILLALAWSAVTGDFSPQNLLIGFLLGAVALLFTQPVTGRRTYLSRVWKVVTFALFFLKEFVLSNLRVARDVLSPRPRMRPGILAIPLDVETDAEITLLANLITLTPGTLSLDVSTDRRVLYIHSVYTDDPEATRAEIKNGFERRVLEVMR